MAEVQQPQENDFRSARPVGLTSATSSQKRTFDEYNDLDLARNGLNPNPDDLNIPDKIPQSSVDVLPCVNEQSKQHFHPNASLVLIGFRGSGRSTLGFIASVILRRRYLDVDQYFRAQTGQTRSKFIAQHGLTRYSAIELRLMCQLLKENSQGCVIGGLYGIREGSHGISLIKKHLRSMPVIYIIRDRQTLQTYLEVDDVKFEQIYKSSSNVLRALSDFEFYNITEGTETAQSAEKIRHLRLKRTEQDFGQLLVQLFPQVARVRLYDNLTAPFLALSPEHRTYTYVLQISLNWLSDSKSDLNDLESGADVVELCIENVTQPDNKFRDEICKQFMKLRRHTRVPIILHVDSSSSQSSDKYMEILRLLLRLAPDYLSVSLKHSDKDLQELTQHSLNTKLVGNYINDRDGTALCVNQGVTTAVARAQRLEMAMIRIRYQDLGLSDPFQCHYFVELMNQTFSIPIAAYLSGAAGKTSICFNKVFSPVVLPKSSETGITLRDAQTALYSSFVLGKKKFYIVGKDVSFSLSPAMHNAAYLHYGMPHLYEIFQTDRISDIDRLLKDPQTGGIAISLPYKIDTIKFIDELDDDAQAIGAVNTILLRSSGGNQLDRFHTSNIQIKGYNTDFIGIHNCVHRKLSTANIIRHNTTALIIGSGGMARASIYACLKLGLKHIFIYNRTLENAEDIAKYFSNRTDREDEKSCQFFVLRSLEDAWPEGHLLPTVIVSTIPAHQIGEVRPPKFMLPENWLRSRTGGVFVDLSYKPVVTQLLLQLTSKIDCGWVTIDGLDILLEQGIAQFELFTSRPAPIHVMRKAVRDRYNEAVISGSN